MLFFYHIKNTRHHKLNESSTGSTIKYKVLNFDWKADRSVFLNKLTYFFGLPVLRALQHFQLVLNNDQLNMQIAP